MAQVSHIMAADTDQAMTPPGVLLTGASSQIGVFALPLLVKAGFRVIAVSRQGKPDGVPVFDKVVWLKETEAFDAADDFEYLLSAGPLSLARRFLDGGSQVKTAVVFSSSSVETKLRSGNTMERDQIRDLLSLESELITMSESGRMKLVIFRPTLIYGCGLDTNISRLAGWIRRFGLMPVNGKAEGLRQPVHAQDLAAVACAALLSGNDLPTVMNLSGGDTLSYSDMVNKIFSAFGKPARLLRLPQWLFVLIANLANALKLMPGINSEMIRRQRSDLVFDDRQARALLNYKPRPFAPGPEDFTLPDFEQ
jgi:nucleoside-diphosphate-sugar epimerase